MICLTGIGEVLILPKKREMRQFDQDFDLLKLPLVGHVGGQLPQRASKRGFVHFGGAQLYSAISPTHTS